LVAQGFPPSSGHHDKGVSPFQDRDDDIGLVAFKVVKTKE